jgi:arginine repressor
VDAERFKEIAGTIAGDDTVLVITLSRSARATVQKRMEELFR